MLENPNPTAVKAKVSIKRMEHDERLADKKYEHQRYSIDKEYEHERYKIKAKDKEKRRDNMIGYAALALMVLCGLFVFFMTNKYETEAANKEAKLQAILAEVMVDIENGDYDAAYIKANTLHYESSDLISAPRNKWNDTRKAVLKQIDEAKKKATD